MAKNYKTIKLSITSHLTREFEACLKNRFKKDQVILIGFSEDSEIMTRCEVSCLDDKNLIRRFTGITQSIFDVKNLCVDLKKCESAITFEVDELNDGDLAMLISSELGTRPYAVVVGDKDNPAAKWTKLLPKRYVLNAMWETAKDQWGQSSEVSVYCLTSDEFIPPFFSQLDSDYDGLVAVFWAEPTADLRRIASKLYSKRRGEPCDMERAQCLAYQSYEWGGGGDEYWSEVFIKDKSLKSKFINHPESLGFKGSYSIY